MNRAIGVLDGVDGLHHQLGQAIVHHVCRGACHGRTGHGKQVAVVIQGKRHTVAVLKRDFEGELETAHAHERVKSTFQ